MDTNKYKAKLQNFKSLSQSNIPKTFNDADLIIDIQNTQNQLFKALLHKNQQYSIRWLFGFDRYIRSLNKSIARPFRSNLKRGHIVEVELFGHFNRELTFLHPAVVLYDNHQGQILVAPISTGLHGNANKLHIDVGQTEGLKHDCAIALDELLMIHKDRVHYQHKIKNKSVKLPDYVLDTIDELILEYFLPQKHVEVKKLDKDLADEKIKVSQLEKKIELLEKQLAEKVLEKIILE